MEIQIHKEIVNVYIRWKEDNLNIQSEYYSLYKIKGIDDNGKFIRSDELLTGKSEDGWLSTDLEIEQLYMLSVGYDKTSHIYFLVPENRGQIIMYYEQAVDYYLEKIKNNVPEKSQSE